jgi:hypothetical protein
VDIETGFFFGLPYHSDAKRFTKDGDPIEKQGVVMQVDRSISLAQQEPGQFQ